MAIDTIISSVGFQDPAGNLLANGFITLDLSQAARITSNGQVAPVRVTMQLDSNAKIITAGNANQIWGNDQLTPSGTFYSVNYYNSNNTKVTPTSITWSITGTAPIDVSAITPLSVSPLVSVTTATLQSLNDTLYADQFSGATADVQIAAAITALGANGGIVDCTGYGNTIQTIATTVVVPENVWLRSSLSVAFQPGSSGMTMFQVDAGSRFSGFNINVSNQASFSGTCILLDDNYRDSTQTLLYDLILTASSFTGTAIFLEGTSSANQSIAFVVFDRIRINNFSAGFSFFASNDGWANGNVFSNIVCDSTSAGFTFDASSATSGSGFAGNVITNYVFEAQNPSGNGNAIQMSGVGRVIQNQFVNLSIFDTTVPIRVLTTTATGNIFTGFWNGTVSDSTEQNTYLSLGLALSAAVSSYNGIATVSGGVPAEYATVDLTAQTAAISTTTLYSVPAAGAGIYRISYVAKVTTVGSVSSTLGALTIGYTDPDSTTPTFVSATNSGNTNTSTIEGAAVVNCKASTNITYAMAYTSNSASSMNYNLHIKLEAL